MMGESQNTVGNFDRIPVLLQKSQQLGPQNGSFRENTLPTNELGEAQPCHQQSVSLMESRDDSLVRTNRDHLLLLKQ